MQRCVVGTRLARCDDWYNEMIAFLITDHLSSLRRKCQKSSITKQRHLAL
jgi:hypothetical protein